MLALSLFIVAGCAGADRAPASAGPAPDAAAATEPKPQAPAQEATTAVEPQESKVERAVASETAPQPEPVAAAPAIVAPAETPPMPAPQAAPVQPAKPVAAPSKPAPAAKSAAAKSAAAKSAAARPAPSASAGSSSSAGSTQPANAGDGQLSLTALEQRLKSTNAIGVMTKITLKNQVDELVERFRAYHDGRDKTPLSQLRHPYDSLIMKVTSLLQDKDPSLASSIAQSREAIWAILTDRNRFSSL